MSEADPAVAPVPEGAPAGLLEVIGLEAGYGRVQVLWGVELEVRERETVVLLGANGAGKTTLLKTLMGLVPAAKGTIRFAGEDATRLRTDLRVRRGDPCSSTLDTIACKGVYRDLTICPVPGESAGSRPGIATTNA